MMLVPLLRQRFDWNKIYASLSGRAPMAQWRLQPPLRVVDRTTYASRWIACAWTKGFGIGPGRPAGLCHPHANGSMGL